MVKIERGKTIFDSSAQTLVNTINCVGVMGKGLALEFKNRYPAMFDKYKAFCDKGVFKPGVLWIYKAEDGKWVLNFPTKIDWRNPSELSYIEEGLKKFVEIYKEKGIVSVAFPLLGCTNGGLNPDVVIPLMEKYLNQCDDCDITIYDNREPVMEEKPDTDEQKELAGDEEPKKIIEEAEQLVEDPPVELVVESAPLESVEINGTIIATDPNDTITAECEFKDNFEIQKTPAKLEEEKTENKESEEQQMLKYLVKEKQEMEKEIETALNEFVDKGNNAETRKEVTRKIVNTINRRGFPMGSIFQI